MVSQLPIIGFWWQLDWMRLKKGVIRWLRDLSKIAGLDTPLVGEGHWRCDGIGVDMLVETCCGQVYTRGKLGP